MGPTIFWFFFLKINCGTNFSFFIFQSLIRERTDKVLDFNSREKKLLLTSISNIKMVDLDVNMFHLVRGVPPSNCPNQYIWAQKHFWTFQVFRQFFWGHEWVYQGIYDVFSVLFLDKNIGWRMSFFGKKKPFLIF